MGTPQLSIWTMGNAIARSIVANPAIRRSRARTSGGLSTGLAVSLMGCSMSAARDPSLPGKSRGDQVPRTPHVALRTPHFVPAQRHMPNPYLLWRLRWPNSKPKWNGNGS